MGIMSAIIEAADKTGKGVHRPDPRFNPPIFRADMEREYLRHMTEIMKVLNESGLENDVIGEVSIKLDSIGSMIGGIISIDPRFVSPELRIFVKSKLIHQLSLAIDNIHRTSDQADDFEEIGKKFRQSLRKHWLLFIDFSGFKNINAIFGHEVGDDILKEVVSELLSNKSIQDYLVKSKLICTVVTAGGDEFVIHLEIKELSFGNVAKGLIDLIRAVLSNNAAIKKMLAFDEASKKTAEKMGICIPDGFQFDFSAGIGCCGLERAFVLDQTDQERIEEYSRLVREGNMDEVLARQIKSLIAEWLNEADIAANEDKSEIMQGFFASDDPHCKTQAALLDSRNSQALMEAKKTIAELMAAKELVHGALSEILRKLDLGIESSIDEIKSRLERIIRDALV